jgi:transcriptional regulator
MLIIAIIFIAIMSQIKLNKLYKEGKTIREIAEEVLISFRDISQIIKKFIEDTMKTKNTKENITSRSISF